MICLCNNLILFERAREGKMDGEGQWRHKEAGVGGGVVIVKGNMSLCFERSMICTAL